MNSNIIMNVNSSNNLIKIGCWSFLIAVLLISVVAIKQIAQAGIVLENRIESTNIMMKANWAERYYAGVIKDAPPTDQLQLISSSRINAALKEVIKNNKEMLNKFENAEKAILANSKVTTSSSDAIEWLSAIQRKAVTNILVPTPNPVLSVYVYIFLYALGVFIIMFSAILMGLGFGLKNKGYP